MGSVDISAALSAAFKCPVRCHRLATYSLESHSEVKLMQNNAAKLLPVFKENLKKKKVCLFMLYVLLKPGGAVNHSALHGAGAKLGQTKAT